MSYNITGTTITLTRGDTFEALVSATKRDGTQYIPVSSAKHFGGHSSAKTLWQK